MSLQQNIKMFFEEFIGTWRNLKKLGGGLKIYALLALFVLFLKASALYSVCYEQFSSRPFDIIFIIYLVEYCYVSYRFGYSLHRCVKQVNRRELLKEQQLFFILDIIIFAICFNNNYDNIKSFSWNEILEAIFSKKYPTLTLALIYLLCQFFMMKFTGFITLHYLQTACETLEKERATLVLSPNLGETKDEVFYEQDTSISENDTEWEKLHTTTVELPDNYENPLSSKIQIDKERIESENFPLSTISSLTVINGMKNLKDPDSNRENENRKNGKEKREGNFSMCEEICSINILEDSKNSEHSDNMKRNFSNITKNNGVTNVSSNENSESSSPFKKVKHDHESLMQKFSSKIGTSKYSFVLAKSHTETEDLSTKAIQESQSDSNENTKSFVESACKSIGDHKKPGDQVLKQPEGNETAIDKVQFKPFTGDQINVDFTKIGVASSQETNNVQDFARGETNKFNQIESDKIIGRENESKTDNGDETLLDKESKLTDKSDETTADKGKSNQNYKSDEIQADTDESKKTDKRNETLVDKEESKEADKSNQATAFKELKEADKRDKTLADKEAKEAEEQNETLGKEFKANNDETLLDKGITSDKDLKYTAESDNTPSTKEANKAELEESCGTKDSSHSDEDGVTPADKEESKQINKTNEFLADKNKWKQTDQEEETRQTDQLEEILADKNKSKETNKEDETSEEKKLKLTAEDDTVSLKESKHTAEPDKTSDVKETSKSKGKEFKSVREESELTEEKDRILEESKQIDKRDYFSTDKEEHNQTDKGNETSFVKESNQIDNIEETLADENESKETGMGDETLEEKKSKLTAEGIKTVSGKESKHTAESSKTLDGKEASKAKDMEFTGGREESQLADEIDKTLEDKGESKQISKRDKFLTDKERDKADEGNETSGAKESNKLDKLEKILSDKNESMGTDKGDNTFIGKSKLTTEINETVSNTVENDRVPSFKEANKIGGEESTGREEELKQVSMSKETAADKTSKNTNNDDGFSQEPKEKLDEKQSKKINDDDGDDDDDDDDDDSDDDDDDEPSENKCKEIVDETIVQEKDESKTPKKKKKKKKKRKNKSNQTGNSPTDESVASSEVPSSELETTESMPPEHPAQNKEWRRGGKGYWRGRNRR